MPEITVYRSTHPDVLALPEQFDKEWRSWWRRIRKLSRELLGSNRDPMVLHTGHGAPSVVGFVATDDERRGKDVPIGWRFDRKAWCLVPFRSKKEGKAIAKRIDECAPPLPVSMRLPGNVPPWVMTGLKICYPQFKMGPDGKAYVVFNCDLAKSNAGPNRFERKYWRQVRPSTYMRMLEDAA